MTAALTAGWGLRGFKRKTHYYRNGEAVCGQGRASDGVRLFEKPDPFPCKKCLHIVEMR